MEKVIQALKVVVPSVVGLGLAYYFFIKTVNRKEKEEIGDVQIEPSERGQNREERIDDFSFRKSSASRSRSRKSSFASKASVPRAEKKEPLSEKKVVLLRDKSKAEIAIHTVAILQKITPTLLKIIKINNKDKDISLNASLNASLNGEMLYKIEEIYQNNRKYELTMLNKQPLSLLILSTNENIVIDQELRRTILSEEIEID